MLEYLDTEYGKLDQESRGMHIYSDWNGWGASEVMENMMARFDREVCKKTVSPYKEWAYVEALACWLKSEEGGMTMYY